MTRRHNRSFHQPFSQLKSLIDEKRVELAPLPECRSAPQSTQSHRQEKELFARAMGDVAPLKHNRHWQLPDRPPVTRSIQPMEEDDHDGALRQLIQTGQGFDVTQTDEYMEASAPGMDPRLTRRLHQGRYTIQDHIDLHGLFVGEAETVLHRFIKQSIARGCQAVRIVHGRGLKSPHKPVLKAKVFEWLTRGPLRGHVIALASAKACDGGAGATYVLLTRKPLCKKQRIR